VVVGGDDAEEGDAAGDAVEDKGSAENEKGCEDEDEGEEEEEDEDDNSFIEVYFQPKYQNEENAFKARCKLEVLGVMLEERMFDELRTKQ